MYLTGMVDKRTLEKYEREAKEKNRETWYLSWCMDTNQEGKIRLNLIYVFHWYLNWEGGGPKVVELIFTCSLHRKRQRENC